MAKASRTRQVRGGAPSSKDTRIAAKPIAPVTRTVAPSSPRAARPTAQSALEPALSKHTSPLAPASSKRSTTVTARPSEVSVAERLVSAFTRAFPYALLEYCLFLLVVYAGTAVALAVGTLLIVLIGVNAATHGKLIALIPATILHEVDDLLGVRQDILNSLAVLGGGLLLWALWSLTTAHLFSWLSIAALVGALVTVLYAQYHQSLVAAS